MTLERGGAVEAITATADGVQLQVRTGEGARTVAARWVVGADGANSLARESLGIRPPLGVYAPSDGSTRDMIFGVAEIVAWLSRTMTLVPGDVIATGTLAGVGAFQNRFLRDGDIVEVQIGGLGAVSNTVRAETA